MSTTLSEAEKIIVLQNAIAALLDFASTVAGSSSWWDDVWAEHEKAISNI